MKVIVQWQEIQTYSRTLNVDEESAKEMLDMDDDQVMSLIDLDTAEDDDCTVERLVVDVELVGEDEG